MSHEVIVPESAGLPELHAATTEIGHLLQLALREKVSMDVIERLVALKERSEDRDAESQYNAALASFQEECPPIHKNREVKPTSDSGMKFGYSYADLEEVVNTIRPFLARHGFSFTHDAKATSSGMLEVVCTVRHIAGHARTASFPAPTSSRAGMSDVQKYASALTFARRQTLIQALGLTTTDADTDGADLTPITEEQARTIEDYIGESGADRARFLKWVGVASVPEILAGDFDRVVVELKKKLKQMGGLP